MYLLNTAMVEADSCPSSYLPVANMVANILTEFEQFESKSKTLLQIRSVQDEAEIVSKPQSTLDCGSKYFIV